MEKDEAIILAQELIKIPSITGNEKAIAEYIKNYLQSCGFETFVNEYNSIVGILKRGEGPTVLFDAHIDTVYVNESDWQHPPFEAVIEDGKLFGRGASDMKGSMAAMLAAAKNLSAEKDWQGTMVITGTSWEEFFEGYTLQKCIESLKDRGISVDYVIIGEASELNLKIGQRGRTRVIVEVKGKPAHSAHPKDGINAMYKALPFIEKIKNLSPNSDDFLGDEIIELIGVSTSPYPPDSVVPYKCTIYYDLRLLLGANPDSILAMFTQIIDQIKSQDSHFEATAYLASNFLTTTNGDQEEIKPFPPAWKMEEDHEIVQKSLAALQQTGLSPQITKYDFCTNGSYSAAEANIPTIGFGPGRENLAHIVDEYVEVDDLPKCAKGYYAIAKSLFQK